MTPRQDRLMRLGVAIGAGALVIAVSVATRAHGQALDANGNRARTVTVPTAAGIQITVSPEFEPKITAFIAANVAAGRRFQQIHCLNFSRSHVRHSRHFTGNACDFRPSPLGRLAGQFGLRNGCSFHDCMHIDNGPLLGATYSARRRRRHK